MRQFGTRDDRGSVLVIVVVLCAILASVGPIVVSNLSSSGPLVLRTSNEHAALAAAESGVEWYRTAIDNNTNYVTYSAISHPDAAMTGWCSSACDLSSTSPAEAFHYTPISTYLYNLSGTDAGEMLLEVTGRGGQAGSYDYVTVQASFTRTSILDNVYFTNYEIIDPTDSFPSTLTSATQCPTSDISGNACTNCTVTPPTISPCSTAPLYTTTFYYTPPGGGAAVDVPSLWTALCEFDSYVPNTFVDSLGVGVIANGGIAASAAAPFYGTYDQGSSTSGGAGWFTVNETDSNGNPTGNSLAIPGDACGTPHTFVNNEIFDGPVYSNDQLVVGGAPAFDGGTATTPPFTSGAHYSDTYKWDEPDSVQVTGLPYTSAVGSYAPRGTTVPPGTSVANASTTDEATFGPTESTPVLDGNESLPAFSTLDSYANAGGCVFTGPTMIEIVAPTSGSGPSTMDVWSPLSSHTASAMGGAVAQATPLSCSGPSGNTTQQFSTTNPLITGIPIPSNGVVYVENYNATGPSSASACFNPLQNNSYYSAASYATGNCYEGDAFVGGEVSGQLSIGAQANIVVSRPLTYMCSDGSSPPSNYLLTTDPSKAAACATSGTEDTLGLDSANDVLISLPVGGSSPTLCSWTGTGQPTNSGGGTVTVLGTANVPEPADIWPNCDLAYPLGSSSTTGPQGLVVDAAIVAHNGSLATQNYAQGPAANWEFYINGADVSDFRGSFGSGAIGYAKYFYYDSRFAFIEPPDLLASSVTVWKDLGYVECAIGDTESMAMPTCPAVS